MTLWYVTGCPCSACANWPSISRYASSPRTSRTCLPMMSSPARPKNPVEHLVGEAATQVLIPGDGHGRNVVGEQAQLLRAIAQGLLGSLARGDVGADAAVARESAGRIEYRIAADRDMPLAAVGPEARELEIAERPCASSTARCARQPASSGDRYGISQRRSPICAPCRNIDTLLAFWSAEPRSVSRCSASLSQ